MKKNGREIDRREPLPTVNRKLAIPGRLGRWASLQQCCSGHALPACQSSSHMQCTPFHVPAEVARIRVL